MYSRLYCDSRMLTSVTFGRRVLQLTGVMPSFLRHVTGWTSRDWKRRFSQEALRCWGWNTKLGWETRAESKRQWKASEKNRKGSMSFFLKAVFTMTERRDRERMNRQPSGWSIRFLAA